MHAIHSGYSHCFSILGVKTKQNLSSKPNQTCRQLTDSNEIIYPVLGGQTLCHVLRHIPLKPM